MAKIAEDTDYFLLGPAPARMGTCQVPQARGRFTAGLATEAVSSAMIATPYRGHKNAEDTKHTHETKHARTSYSLSGLSDGQRATSSETQTGQDGRK